MENANIYRALQESINEYEIGFPATKSGVELKILKVLFTEQHAELYIKMAKELQTVEMIASRVVKEVDETKQNLQRMIERGTILCMEKEGSTVYSPAPYMVGLYENMSHNMDESLATLLEEYHKEAYFRKVESLPPLCKFIPVHQTVEVFSKVLPLDDVVEILRSKSKIAVIDCTCRKQVKLIGTPTNILEVCFAFNGFADYYVNKRQQGRFVSLNEAIEIQKQCDEAGLVTQSATLKEHEVLCHCDKHCIMFRAWGESRPADHFRSNYSAEVDVNNCSGCGKCTKRCSIDAVTVGQDRVAIVNLDRCFGCGICVTSCPTKAILLKQKPEAEWITELI